MPPSASNPNPNYDFIFNDKAVPKKSKLPTGLNPIVLIAGALIVIMILVLILSAVLGSKGSLDKASLTDVIGKAQEINRISSAQQPNLKDPNVSGLAATAAVASDSDQATLSNYLTSHKVGIDKKKLALYATNDKSIDNQLTAAQQSDTLDQAYSSYLKTALNSYAEAIKTAYAANQSINIKNILQQAYNSTETLLGSQVLKS
jgi:hypothetical protein